MVVFIHPKAVVFVYVDAEVAWALAPKVVNVEIVIVDAVPPVSFFYDFMPVSLREQARDVL